MRVTTFGVNTQYLSDLNNIMTKYQHLEMELSTGRKLNSPADNPVAFEADITAQTQLNQVGQWQSNVTTALSTMQSTDSAMGNLESTLGNIRTSLVSAVNGTNTATDMKDFLSYVQQQVQAVAQVADTSDGQQYIFGGTQGKTTPVQATGGVLTWNTTASTPVQKLTVGQSVSIGIGVDGSQVFNTSPGNGAPSLIQNLNSIVTDLTNGANATSHTALQTAMQNIQKDLQNLDANISNVTSIRSDLGGRMKRVQGAQTQLAQMQTALKTQKGNTEDANIAQVMTQLTMQQTVYQAALMSGQRLILPTLAQTLK